MTTTVDTTTVDTQEISVADPEPDSFIFGPPGSVLGLPDSDSDPSIIKQN
jgi:hypothetical protein